MTRMKRRGWNVIAGVLAAGLLLAGGFPEDARAGEERGIALHHQAAGLTVSLLTQPSPPRAGENLWRVDRTDVQGRPIAHAQVRLVLTQAFPMAGMHPEPPREVEAASTHVGGYVGRVHLATPGRWEVIVNVLPPGRPATQARFYRTVEPS